MLREAAYSERNKAFGLLLDAKDKDKRKDEIMEYREFMEEVREQLQDLMGEEVHIKIQKIRKNNGICLDGMSIWREGENVSPTIYLDSFYERCQEGVSVGEIAQEIKKLYWTYRIEKPIDPDFYCNFSNIWEQILCKVINYKKNQELLEDIPYIRYLDLAVVFYCAVKNERIGKGMILIHNSHLKFWDITAADLAAIGRENTKEQQVYELFDMIEIFTEGMDVGEAQQFEREIPTEEQIPMYVLTNQEKNLGSVCILYDFVLSDVGEQLGEDYYILPSSIHECIVVPKRKEIDPEELKQMVREINDTQVQPEEVLSDEVYQYDRAYHRLSIVLEREENYPFLEAEIVPEGEI